MLNRQNRNAYDFSAKMDKPSSAWPDSEYPRQHPTLFAIISHGQRPQAATYICSLATAEQRDVGMHICVATGTFPATPIVIVLPYIAPAVNEVVSAVAPTTPHLNPLLGSCRQYNVDHHVMHTPT